MSTALRTALPLVLIAAGVYAAPATAPAPGAATKPATTPAVVVNLSTPSATLTTLTDAVAAHDIKAVKSAILVTATDKEVADGLFHALDASFHFQDAVLARFGPDAAKALRSPEDLEAAMAERRRLLKTADVAIHDDSAILTFHPPADSTLHVTHNLLLHKVAGDWKIDAASMFGLDDPARAAKVRQSSALLNKIADLMDSTAADIQQNKFSTMQEVRESMMPKLHDILAAAATAPATAPAPATQPH